MEIVKIEISQVQNHDLLKEHAHSSFNFSFMTKYEWIIALFFISLGPVVLSVSDTFVGFIFTGIGIFELAKYPTRVKRWINKKAKEKIFGKLIYFSFDNIGLTISYENSKNTYNYHSIKKCLISDTGVLFKITYQEYYYISFKSIDPLYNRIQVLDFLKTKFKKAQIRQKRV